MRPDRDAVKSTEPSEDRSLSARTVAVPFQCSAASGWRTILAVALLSVCTIVPRVASASCTGRTDPRPAAAAGKSPLFAGQQAPSSIKSSDEEPSITGLWHVYFVSNGQPFDEGFDEWHSDGTEILNDTAPPQPANGAGTVCLGVYKKTGPLSYKLRHPFWSFDANANLVGVGMITENLTLAADGNSYQGTFTFDLYDLSGNLVFETKGDVNAKRITAD